MIQKIYLGTRISDIAATEFRNGFEDPLCSSPRYPGLVLAALHFVPLSAASWCLAKQQCGGDGCYIEKAAILPLPISPDICNSLLAIAEERFAGEYGLAEFGFTGGNVDESESTERLRIRHRYIAALSTIGLSCTSPLSFRLTHVLYPIDATSRNVEVLCGRSLNDLAELLDSDRTDICLFIVGRNTR